MSDAYSQAEPDTDLPSAADLFVQDRRQSTFSALTHLDSDPDEAARADELSQATGVPAPLVHGDLENFEAQHKKALVSDLLNNNSYLRDFVSSHPLAPQLASDSWPQLDKFSETLLKMAPQGVLATILKDAGPDILHFAKEGLQQSADSLLGSDDKSIEEYGKSIGMSDAAAAREQKLVGGRMQRGSLMQLVGPVQTLLSPLLGILRHNFSAPIENLIGAPKELTEGVVMAGAGFLGLKGQHAEMMQLHEAVSKVETFVKAGKVPPVGVDPMLDLVHIEDSLEQLKQLNEAQKDAQAVPMRERSPEAVAAFVRQHDQSSIGVSAEKIRELYGDKEPSPGDNILGWVPDLGDRLTSAEVSGGDVSIPLADWLAKVDPEVAKELRDHIRVRPEGVTAEEAKTLGPRAKAMVEAQAESSPEVSALSKVVDDAQKELEAAITAGDQGRIDLAKQNLEERTQDLNDLTKPVIPKPDLAVESLRSAAELKPMAMTREASETPAREGYSYRDDAGVKATIIPKKALLDKEAELQKAMVKLLDRITDGNLRVKPAGEINVAGQLVQGVYTWDKIGPLMMYALDAKNVPHTVRHEAIHFLKEFNFIRKDEWTALEQEARLKRWVDKHNVKERWARHNFDESALLEEAIAEEFATWGVQREAVDKMAQKYASPKDKVFTKIQEFIDLAKEALKEIFGHTPSIDELFEKIESGEVGARKPGKSEPRGVKTEEKQLELPQSGTTRMEDREPFNRGMAIDLPQPTYNRLLKLIAQRNAEDVAHAEKIAAEDLRRRQSKEWKAAKPGIQAEVQSSLSTRPDIAADHFFGLGELHGDKLDARPKLAAEALTDVQKISLPKDYIAKEGMNPDDAAGLFGYPSGDAMIDHLGTLIAQRETAGMGPKAYLDRLVNMETDRQLEAKFRDPKEDLIEAKDYVASQTQLNILHDEMLALGLKNDLEFSISKHEIVQAVKDDIARTPMSQIDSDAFLAESGRSGRKAFEAAAKEEWVEALKHKQAQFLALIKAKEAVRVEKIKTKWDKLVKRYSRPLDPDKTPPVKVEYLDFVHDLMIRAGEGVKRSIQNIQESIAENGHKDFAGFLKEKTDTFFRDFSDVPDFLRDSNFRRPVNQLTVEEFEGLQRTVQTLVKQGRDEQKLIHQGEEADRAVITDNMKEELRAFPLKQYPLEKGGKPSRAKSISEGAKTFLTGLINVETYANRWDRDNPRGPFNQWMIRPMSEAANRKAKLDRDFSKPYRGLEPIENADKQLTSPFVDPLSITLDNPQGSPYINFTRENVATMISNAGNHYNWNVLTKGHKVDPEATMRWLIANSTKADWVRAEKLGKIFSDAFELSEIVHRNVTGLAPERIELNPVRIEFPNGEVFESPGWYHPIIRDPKRTNSVREAAGAELMDPSTHSFVSINDGYTKKRTGTIDVLALDHKQVPMKLNQILHDVAFRAEVIETAKIIKDKSLRTSLRQHYGTRYVNMLDSWIKDSAGGAEYNSELWQQFNRVSNAARTNVIGTLIGFNPFTVAKHGPTALVNSMYEAGFKDFSRAFGTALPDRVRASVMDTFAKGDEVGDTMWQFAKDKSEELQRRTRHWDETISGVHKDVYGQPTLRDKILEYGSHPVALSDLISAVPTWLAVYQREIGLHSDEGMATYIADRAVRRAHGSTAITNQPGLVRGGGPMHSWLTTLYGFFGTQMQRRAELAFQLNDTYQLGKQKEIAAAVKKIPGIAALTFSAIIWPTIIEQLVSSIGTNDKRSTSEMLFYAGLSGIASSILYGRDLAYAFTTDRDPSVGLASTPLHDIRNVLHDLKLGKKMFSKEHAGKTVEDFLTTFGDFTGMAPKAVAHGARFVIDYATGQQRPKTASDTLVGLTKGTMKRRIER